MKVFITRNIPDIGPEKIKKAGHEVIISKKDGVLTKSELIEQLKVEKPDALICLLTDKIDAEILDVAPNCKVVANYAVGFDNIDISEAKNRNIVVTNTPGVLTEAVAEHTVALILALARRIVESDQFLRQGKYEGWDPMLLLGLELENKILGIVGCGRIGERVANIMHKGFKMNILYYDQKQNQSLDTDLNAEFVSNVNELLHKSDVVSIHLPATEKTRHLLNRETLANMKVGSLLINTSRGSIIDEKVLTEMLKSGPLGGAALDVFENEPDVHPDLLSLSNVIITPHTASATKESRDRMSVVVADNVISVLNGEKPINSVL